MDRASVFPPFGLRVTSGDLELRLPDDAELVRLAEVAAAGIHPPERSPFVVAWNVGESEEVRRAAFELGVFRDGVPVGVQGVGAKAFAAGGAPA